MELDGHLSLELCTEIIEKFNTQTSLRMDEWPELTDKLNDGRERYLEWLDVIFPWKPDRLCLLTCSGMEVKKVTDGEWTENSSGMLSFMWYLNAEGETDFLYKKVKARPGKLLVFPSSWNYIHKNSSVFVVKGCFT